MTDAPPVLLIVGPPGHGVVEYGADVASALRRLDSSCAVVRVAGIGDALDAAEGARHVHLHATDRILGGSPEEAAAVVERLAARTRLTLTLHDLPQPSDGTMQQRRAAAYRRMFDAAAGVAVNSAHERMLVAEHLGSGVAGPAAVPAVVPLGTRTGHVEHSIRPSRATGERDLVVLIAGFVYPGKGHAAAVAASAAAVAMLRAQGEVVGDPVVRALGRASSGHESDVDVIAAGARRAGAGWELTGFLADDAFATALRGEGIPLAAHEHVSASRSMLDWCEAGRRPLVVESRYAAEMDALRPGTMRRYRPGELPALLAQAWRNPTTTWLPPGSPLAPTVDDAAAAYRQWWAQQ